MFVFWANLLGSISQGTIKELICRPGYRASLQTGRPRSSICSGKLEFYMSSKCFDGRGVTAWELLRAALSFHIPFLCL